jgi:membrane protease YdiL (CAAX protease family)
MKNPFFFYLLLLLLVVTDAWLLAHPNLLGRIGVWLYKYDYLKTFPRALATVVLATAITLGIGYGIRRWAPKFASLLLGVLLVGALVILIQTVVQFSSGSYAYTGAGFKTGAVLLPLILVIVIVQNLWESFRKKTPDTSPDPLPNHSSN